MGGIPGGFFSPDLAGYHDGADVSLPVAAIGSAISANAAAGFR
jgi:hypothetical protein